VCDMWYGGTSGLQRSSSSFTLSLLVIRLDGGVGVLAVVRLLLLLSLLLLQLLLSLLLLLLLLLLVRRRVSELSRLDDRVE